MRLIDADAITERLNMRIQVLRKMHGDYDHYTDGFDDCAEYVFNAPTIDAENFVRYHMDEISRTIRWQPVEVDTEKPYCPNCGARMEKDGDAPTIDPESLRPQGEWEDEYGGQFENPRYRCSVCKEKAIFKIDRDCLGGWHEIQALTPYCPICGARLKKDGDA